MLEQIAAARRLGRACCALVLGLSLALGACGGGGSDTATPAGDPSALARTSGTTTACDSAQMQAQLIEGINALRARAQTCGAKGPFAAAGPLRWNTALHAAAAGHSADMAARDYFSHTSPEGGTMANRADAAGYRWTLLAENLALGQTDVASVLSDWMDSDGHCANIMAPNLQDVALSCVSDASGTRHWTLALGRP